jgi:hypothetical protein
LGVARAVLAQPEHCGTVDPTRMRAAIDEAVQWAGRMQQPDGRWIYRYDARTDTDLGIYELVRHSGMTMALYQAAGFGVAGARDTAERADAFARTRLVAAGGGQALAAPVDGDGYDVGATALYLNALVYRRAVSGSTDDDALLADLGRFLVATVAPSGAVAAQWDAGDDAPRVATSSPFTTGEALWGISRLEGLVPGGWREPALRVVRYLATARDDAEDRWPDVPDHWAAYSLAQIARWDGPPVLDDELLAYGRRIAALESLSIRYESQRTGSGFSVATRGPIALGAGVGALTEALAALRAVPGLGHERSLRERAECAAGVLLDRQTTAAEAARFPAPERVRGTWLRHGITQIDDQQHAMSALMLLVELEETP